MSKIILRSPIVGTFARQGGKALLAALSAKAELLLDPEPENPYDSAAVRVLVRPSEVGVAQREELRMKLLDSGVDWDEWLGSNEPQALGYVIAAGNKKLGSWDSNIRVGELMGAAPGYTARLEFSADGQALVRTEGEIAGGGEG